MKLELKLFTFQGSPVYLKLWFLLLFAWISPTIVVALFTSVLIHELAHAFVANRLGYRVRQIYVDIFNGAAEIDLDHCPERDLIRIVAAGPLINFFLAMLSLLLYPYTGFEFILDVFIVNILLSIFNIIPIFPMDGGRILRAFLMMKMKSNRRLAKRISDWVSLSFSILLLIYSLFSLSYLLAIFTVFFIYIALKELEFVK